MTSLPRERTQALPVEIAGVSETATFCRICEPFCGLIATVKDDRLLSLRPDPDHPTSQGFACPKGVAYTDIQNDPERVLFPLKRQNDGTFERVTWDEALEDISQRIRAILEEHGDDSIGMYMGNPGALNFSMALWAAFFMQAMKSGHLFTSGSQDTNSRFAASALLYGMPLVIPVPDLEASELVVILGANPVVSHGSLISTGRIKDKLHDVVDRGGRVLVIDPRRTETAAEFEWMPIVPDADAWFLLSLLWVMSRSGTIDEQAVSSVSVGWEELRSHLDPFDPELTEEHTGVPAEELRILAGQLIDKKAVVYGRTGTCLGQYSTLVNFLIDVVNLVSGNLDARGGCIFPKPVTPLLDKLGEKAGTFTYDSRRTRVGGLREILGMEPAANMPAEITTPGPGQIKAMFVGAGNPVISVPDGDALEAALPQLDLMVSIDLYVNETGQYADYVLPATAMYERDDLPMFASSIYAKPFLQVTDAVVSPAGEARPEWEILSEIARRAKQSPTRARISRALGKRGIGLNPRLIRSLMVRTGPHGDMFGVRRGGLNVNKLKTKYPHGILLADEQPTGWLRDGVIRHKDNLLHLHHDEIRSEMASLQARRADPAFPLRLIGMREIRSENSWMHNSKILRAARPAHAARMHPDDAEALGLAQHSRVRLTSKSGEIELPVLITEDIKAGVVAVPHGWGHGGKSRWSRAKREGGANSNLLASSDPADLEQLSGSSHLSGIPIRAERADS